MIGSELGSKWMAWLIVREGGRVVGVWNRVENMQSKASISGYGVVVVLVEGSSGSMTRMWKNALALSVCMI